MGVKPLTPNIAKVGGYLFLCIFVVGLIFSSIALLVSTRMSSASTIGISIAIGVVIPITSMVGMFTQKATYDKKKNPALEQFGSVFMNVLRTSEQAQGGPLTNAEKDKFSTAFDKLFKLVEDPMTGIYNIGVDPQEGDKFNKYWPADLSYQLTAVGSLATEDIITTGYKDSLVQMGVPSEMTPKVKTVMDERDPMIGKTVEEAEKIVYDRLLTSATAVYDFGKMVEKMMIDRKAAFIVNTGKDKGKIFAKNQHEADLLNVIEQFVHRPVNILIYRAKLAKSIDEKWTLSQPDEYSYKNFVAEMNKRVGPTNIYKNTLDEEETYNDLMNVVHNNLQHFGYIRTVDYVNRRTLLWCYIALAIAIVPISLLIMRKKDFR